MLGRGIGVSGVNTCKPYDGAATGGGRQDLGSADRAMSNENSVVMGHDGCRI